MFVKPSINRSFDRLQPWAAAGPRTCGLRSKDLWPTWRCVSAGHARTEVSGTPMLASLPYRRYACVMRPLRYSINVTLDGCCDHREGIADEDLHRHAVENLEQADALLF